MKFNGFKTSIIIPIIISTVGFQLRAQLNQEADLTPHSHDKIGARVIYGDDNRLDLYQMDDPLWRQLADSTVALIKGSSLKANPSGRTEILGHNFGERLSLCEDEPFREQNSAAFCSGALIGKDLIITAGHCIQNEASCHSTYFVFGFAIREEGQLPDDVDTNEVYGCAELIHSEINTNDKADFAIIRLDREVTNHSPLTPRIEDNINANEIVSVIGHPSGLPTKITTSGIVRQPLPGYFVTNLDTYGGNSGSAVFNEATGLVEGILVRGESDFVNRNGCLASHRCAEDECRGEDVTNIYRVLPYLPRDIHNADEVHTMK